MADGQNTIDAAAAKASAEAAKKIIASKLAEEPVSVTPAPAPAAPKAKAPAKKTKTAAAPLAAAPAAAVPPRKFTPVETGTAPAVSPAPTLTELKDKIMATAPNTTTDFTAKMRDTAEDLQSRAKAAFEKGSEMTADVTAFHKGNFDALVESGKVLAAGMQDLGRTAVEDAKSAAETVTADVKAMAAVKSPTELFQLQGEIARRNLDTLVAKTSKNAEVWMKLANDAFAPLSSRASVAMERLTKAA